MSRLEELVRSFTDVRLLVIGDPMLDRYISGPSTRLSPEAAVPVIAVERTDEYPGGAANAAANGAVLGARVTMAGLIGDDRAGDALRRLLAQAGVSQPEAGTVAGRITLSNTRIVAGTTPLARIDEGTTSPPEEPDMERLKAAIKHAWAACDAVIISDYGYGSVPPEIRLLIERLQQASPRVLAVDARDLRTYRPAAPTVVKPNHYEATALIARSGGPGGFPGDIAEYAAPLFECTGAAIVALSLGRAGAAVFERDGSVHRTSARPRNQLQAAGAGDCYLTAFALTLASGGSCQDSAEIAAAAAQVSVDGEGTRTCGQAELLAKLGPQPSLATWEQLEERLARARARGQRVVFTNGVFDILHPGHIAYLRAARELGDLLIVGLNSDASTTRLKGPQRPINTVTDRAAVMSALASVDLVVEFEEDTPERLLEVVRPDVFVKGGDYTPEQLPEAGLVESFGGRVVLLDYLDGRSTTQIIRRVIEAPRPESLAVASGAGA